jgi:hypothetical protein
MMQRFFNKFKSQLLISLRDTLVDLQKGPIGLTGIELQVSFVSRKLESNILIERNITEIETLPPIKYIGFFSIYEGKGDQRLSGIRVVLFSKNISGGAGGHIEEYHANLRSLGGVVGPVYRTPHFDNYFDEATSITRTNIQDAIKLQINQELGDVTRAHIEELYDAHKYYRQRANELGEINWEHKPEYFIWLFHPLNGCTTELYGPHGLNK